MRQGDVKAHLQLMSSMNSWSCHPSSSQSQSSLVRQSQAGEPSQNISNTLGLRNHVCVTRGDPTSLLIKFDISQYILQYLEYVSTQSIKGWLKAGGGKKAEAEDLAASNQS